MIEWKDGKLVSPAMVNEDGTVTPAVYEGSTPLSSYNLNRMQKEIIDDGIIVSPTEPTTDRRKVWFQKGKNIIPTNFEQWVQGQYNIDTGLATDSTIRIRLKELLKIKAGQTYYFNTFSNFGFIVRTYDINGTFLRSVGGIENGSTFTANNNEEYISITIYDPDATTTYPLYDDYRALFANKTIKPMICLNSEEDKTFKEYINPAIYVKDNNNTYEKFIKKEEGRIDITNEIEYVTNEYIDGHRVYRKRMLLGYGPNNSSPKAYPIGVKGFNIIKTNLCLKQNELYIPLPLISADTAAIVNYYINGTDLIIQAGRDRSSFLVRAEIYYIKY